MDKLKNKDEDQSEVTNKKLVEKTIEKWLILQKTVKEEITLEDIIKKQQQNDTKKLEEYITKYYDFKLKSRKAFEDITNFKVSDSSEESKDKPKIKDFVIEEESKVLTDTTEPIKNLLFIFRNNYDYVLQLISLIEEENDDKENVESIVELFCHQFYDNILIPNPEQEELLILIYKLLEKEINQMNSASINDFLHDSTFIGKFMSSFSKKQELSIFLSILLNPIIDSIENESVECLDMSFLSIKNYIKEEKKKGYIKLEKMDEINLFKNIPKARIHFKKSFQIEEEKKEENRKTKYNMETNQVKERNSLDLNKNNSSKKDEKIEYNEDYLEFLNQETLISKIKKAKDNKDLKEFYEYQLSHISDENDLFCNTEHLELLLNEPTFQNDKNLIIDKYKKNFLFIQSKVDEIIQSLIDKINLIPYTVRCISKLIFFLISKRFPLLPKYLKNSFIGKLIFNKCIFPVLSLENRNAVEDNIYGLDTKKCLNNIIDVLSSANKCLLFDYKTDIEKIIFNSYILEIVPILNTFYEKLIDIELPKTLNYIVLQAKDNNNNSFNFKNRKNCNFCNKPTPLYDYFRENTDEIMKIQSICFSLSDILFIFDYIDKEINQIKFKGFPNYDSFIRAINYIKGYAHKLDLKLKEETSQRKFVVIFNEEKNSQLAQLFKKKKIDEKNYPNKDLLLLKIKDCIKQILKGLNLLNIKDYSYLNMASSNEKFFQAIHYTLGDIQLISEIENEIPLNWYGEFLANNLNNLEHSYLENDFEKLYEELYNEEIIILNELNSYSSIINTRDGMNLRCAETILEKTKIEKFHIQNAKQLQKLEYFIENDKTEICIEIREVKEKSGLKNNIKNEEVEPLDLINIVPQDKCQHRELAFMANMEGEKPNFETHVKNFKEFISKFDNQKKIVEKDNKKDELRPMHKYIEEDIKTGEPNHKIYKAFNQYMELLKEKLKKSRRYAESSKLDKDLNKFTDKIKDYITKKIYKYVYPKQPLDKDIEFYNKTKYLDWITPEHLQIKKLYQSQLGLAIYWINKMDTEKSVLDKIKCIQNAHSNIVNNLKFTSGKKDIGIEETNEVFQYAIIKAQPKRIISNLNYIECFLGSSGGQSDVLKTQLKTHIEFILNGINEKTLKMSKEEYYKKIEESKKKYRLK